MNPCPKIKNYRSERYLEFIRSKPSLKSGRIGTLDDPIQSCHQNFGMGGTALKSPDIFCVPLLRSEHPKEHQKGNDTFWKEFDEEVDLKQRCLEYINEFLYLNKGKKI